MISIGGLIVQSSTNLQTANMQAESKDNHNVDHEFDNDTYMRHQAGPRRDVGRMQCPGRRHSSRPVRLRRAAIDPTEVQAAVARMEGQMLQMQAALAQEHANSSELRKVLDKKHASEAASDAPESKVQMEDIAPKKYVSIQGSGNILAWGRAMKDNHLWHDPACTTSWVIRTQLEHGGPSEPRQRV